MKTCSYCGNQYPDEIAVCPLDGQTLTPAERKKITGVWRGIYGYGPRDGQPSLWPVAFTLKLKQGWFDRFEGFVTEDQPQGTPGTGMADGYFGWPKIEFTKQMPVGYWVREDGTRVTFREYLIGNGQPCEHELPSPPILYQGRLLDNNRMQGIWTIDSSQALALARKVPLTRISGYWCAEFVTTDLKANPSGGPTESLFDKSLLSKAELEEVEGVEYCSLGKFNVADLQALIERFGQTNIRFKTKRDKEAMQQALPIMEFTGAYAGTTEMIEIFVHPDDLEEAEAIVHPGDQI